MKIPDLTTKHVVMSCPACGQDITADVTVSVHPGDMKVNPTGKVDLSVKARLERFHVTHHCQGRVEAVADPEAAA